MPAVTYYLDQAKTNPLKFEWKAGWKNFTITNNNHQVGVINDMNELKQGKSFKLASGQTVSAKLNMVLGVIPELELLLDNKPVPGSPTDPVAIVKQGHIALLAIGALNIFLGVLVMTIKIDFLRDLGVGTVTIVIGALFLALGFWGKQKNSEIAFMIGLALMAADIVLSFIAAAESNGSSPTSGIVVKIIICILLYKAAQAAKKLKAEKSTSSPLVPKA